VRSTVNKARLEAIRKERRDALYARRLLSKCVSSRSLVSGQFYRGDVVIPSQLCHYDMSFERH
jgi:hypothetical protein